MKEYSYVIYKERWNKFNYIFFINKNEVNL